jgi:hypothetical protein
MLDEFVPKKVCRRYMPLIAMFLATCGCGDRPSDVSGTVTLDGQPIVGGENVRGTVTFTRVDGSGTPAIGILDENGQYELSTTNTVGAAPGKYQVTVSATEIIIPESGATPSGRPITPRRYARAEDSGLTAEVTPGSNRFDFALTTAGTK